MNAPSAVLPALRVIYSKNLTPGFLSSVTCVRARKKPLCVKWCITDALTCEEREEECEEVDELGTGLSSLVGRYGLEEIMDRIVKLAETEKE